MRTKLALSTLLAGCTQVTLTGTVFEAPGSAAPAAGVQVQLLDGGFGLVDEVVSDGAGGFELQISRGGYVHVVVRGEGLVPVAHPGESGTGSAYAIPDGQIFALPEDVAAAWRALFAGCPGAGSEGPMILGALHAGLQSDAYPDGVPWPNAFAFRSVLDDLEEGRVDACYLDEDGAYDAAAQVTSSDARFAIFDVPAGPALLSAGQRTTTGTLVSQFPVYVPDDGAVVLLPAYVPL